MTNKQQCIAFYTLLRRELVRMMRIASQVFLPPVITTFLYFLIFGSLIGPRIGKIDGIPYPLFIAPGLIMMSVITNAYGNVSSSFFSARFQKSIEELLVSPMHNVLILLGYIAGGVLRGLIVAILVYMVSIFFVDIHLRHLPLTLVVVLLVAMLFSLAGFINGMLARNFDDVMIIPTFILAPLTYLGGIFYSVDMLSPFWRTMTYFNPIYYMIHALRQAMLGQHMQISMLISLGIILLVLAILAYLALTFFRKGIGLRE
jgi:ABC-2 type transport system permease protein